MRASVLLAILVLTAGAVGSAHAQFSFFRLFGGGDKTPAVVTPGQVTQAVLPPALTTASSNSSSSPWSNLSRFVPSLSLPGFLTSSSTPAQVPMPIGPILPGQHADAYAPRLPTTVLPPPEHPDALYPLPPIQQPF